MERIWLEMANESLAAAELLFKHERFRSCVNRAYYAMFQATQSILLHSGQEPPDRGNWSHTKTVEGLGGIAKSALRRQGTNFLLMRQRFTRVMQLRLDADYNPTARFDVPDVRDALRFSRQFLRMAKEINLT